MVENTKDIHNKQYKGTSDKQNKDNKVDKNPNKTKGKNKKGGEKRQQLLENEEISRLKKEISKLKNDLEERNKEAEKMMKNSAMYEDKYYRALADLENSRKLYEKERSMMIDHVKTKMLTEVLELKDNVERAISSLGKIKVDENVKKGIDMIMSQFEKFIRSENIVPFGEVGEAFDHKMHEALYSIEGDVKNAVIKEIYVKGYKIGDRILRHAKVMVMIPRKKQKKEIEEENAKDENDENIEKEKEVNESIESKKTENTKEKIKETERR